MTQINLPHKFICKSQLHQGSGGMESAWNLFNISNVGKVLILLIAKIGSIYGVVTINLDFNSVFIVGVAYFYYLLWQQGFIC